MPTRFQLRSQPDPVTRAQAMGNLLSIVDIAKTMSFKDDTLVVDQEMSVDLQEFRCTPSQHLPEYLTGERTLDSETATVPRYQVFQLLRSDDVEFVLMGSGPILQWVKKLDRDHISAGGIHTGHMWDILGVPAYVSTYEAEEMVIVFRDGSHKRYIPQEPQACLYTIGSNPAEVRGDEVIPVLADGFAMVERTGKSVGHLYCSESAMASLSSRLPEFTGRLWGAEVIPVSNLPYNTALIVSDALFEPEVIQVVWERG